MPYSSQLIYKICHKLEWLKTKRRKRFYGSKKDIQDGYIHFSAKNQIKSTVKKYFLNKNDLIILEVDIKLLKNLLWEKSRNGLLFPHLYSPLNINSVKATYDLPLKKNGKYQFPNWL